MTDESLQLLIIEDNRGDLLLLQQYLSMSQLILSRTYEAETLEDAMSILKSSTPELIFIDLFLPDSNGLETFTAIINAAPGIPIIVLSGLADSGTALKTIQLGAQDYLIKGEFDEKLLEKTIAYSIERKKIQERLNESLQMHKLVGYATNDVIFDWDLATAKVAHLSHAIEDNFGYTPDQLRDSREWWCERVHPEDLPQLKQSIRTTLAARQPNGSHGFRFRASNNTYRQVYARALILYNASNTGYRIIGVLQDITELKRLQEKMNRAKIINQQRITEATIQSQENERAELGRELHDNINQILATSKMFIDIAIKNGSQREELLPKSFTYLTMAIEEIRKLSKSLVPPSLGDIGIEEAIDDLLAAAAETSTVKFNFTSEDISGIAIPPSVQLMIYRIVQEQLNNIRKYAHATEVVVRLKLEHGMLLVRISDNGVGFQLGKKSMGIGLRNIRSRTELHGGKLKISTAPNRGCTLHISIPIPAKDKHQTNLHEKNNGSDC